MPNKAIQRDDEAERSLFGAILAAGEKGTELALDVQVETIWPICTSKWKRYLQAVNILIERHEPIDMLSIRNVLQRELSDEDVMVSDLLDIEMDVRDYGLPSSAPSYAKRIRQAAARREIEVVSRLLAANTISDARPVEEWLPDTIATLEGIDCGANEKNPTLSENLVGIFDNIDKIRKNEIAPKIPIGLHELDKRLGGYWRGDFIVIAGRPGTGKTSLATNMATLAAKAGHPVGFISLEMSQQELTTRIIASEAEVPFGKIREGTVSNAEMQRMFHSSQILSEGANIDICDNARSWTRIERAMRKQIKDGAKLIFIDYLGLIDVPGNDPRHAQIGMITRKLKIFAGSTGARIVALCQLNRDIKFQKPQLSNLRDSGSVEQDAITVLFVHREEDRPEDVREIIIAKQRFGQTSSFEIGWRGDTTTFHDLEMDLYSDYTDAL